MGGWECVAPRGRPGQLRTLDATVGRARAWGHLPLWSQAGSGPRSAGGGAAWAPAPPDLDPEAGLCLQCSLWRTEMATVQAPTGTLLSSRLSPASCHIWLQGQLSWDRAPQCCWGTLAMGLLCGPIRAHGAAAEATLQSQWWPGPCRGLRLAGSRTGEFKGAGLPDSSALPSLTSSPSALGSGHPPCKPTHRWRLRVPREEGVRRSRESAMPKEPQARGVTPRPQEAVGRERAASALGGVIGVGS